MVAESPKKPFIIFNGYLDDGTVHWSDKTKTFKGTTFSKRVTSYGTVDRSISYPPGDMQVNDAEIRFQDEDNQVRAFFDAITPLRREGEIIFEFEDTDEEEPIVGPLYRGEIISPRFPTAEAVIKLKDITSIWKNRRIPRLITRDKHPLTGVYYWPNLPDDLESAFAPIIFGRVESYDRTGVDKQGVIVCPYVDTVNFRYCVARHKCHDVFAVYRREKLGARFKLVPPAEYTIVEQSVDINDVTYTFTFIQFVVQQKDGTVIHADVSGVNYRWDFDTGLLVEGEEVRNVVDSLVTLIHFILRDEIHIEKFDVPSFFQAWRFMDTIGWKCDGAVTESDNLGDQQGVTSGEVVSQLTSNFLLDFYQTNRGLLSIRYYQPSEALPLWAADIDYKAYDSVNYGGSWFMAIQDNVGQQPDTNADDWTELYGDFSIPVTADDTLRKTLESAVPDPDKIKNRLRVRFHRQNAGLTDYYSSASSGQWSKNFTLDNITDQDEMIGLGGQNPLLEEEIEYPFIRDDDTALEVTKKRMGYHTLRSYVVEFEVAAPAVVRYMQLAQPVSITHIGGIGATGWTNEILKVYQIAFDLDTFRARVKAVKLVTIPDASLSWSITETDDPHAAQVRIPPHPVLVNDAVLLLDPDSEPQVDLNDFWPVAPALPSELVTVDLIYNLISTTPPPPVTVPSNEVAITNVHWQVDNNTNPRKVSAYVALPYGLLGTLASSLKIYTGTLFPDERPTGLTDDDIYRVIFYATDFDHMYFWVGTSETGTPSGWRCIEQTAGKIDFFIEAPVAPGYKLCDGVGTVRRSHYDGSTTLVSVPNMIGAYPKGSAAYTGPAQTVATAPSISILTSGFHTHAVTTTNHTHDAVWTIGGASSGEHSHTASSAPEGINHTHTFSFTGVTGTLSSEGAHNHGGSTAIDGAHEHPLASGPTAPAGVTIEVPTHAHSLSAVTTATDPTTHGHGLSGLSGSLSGSGTISEASEVVDSGELLNAAVSALGDAVSMAGVTVDITGGSVDSANATHSHGFAGGTNTGLGGGDPVVIEQDAIISHVQDTDSEHSHVINGELGHTHTFSGGSGGGTTGNSNVAHSHGITVNNGGGHTHSLDEVTSPNGGQTVVSSIDGEHAHPGSSVGNNGEPARVGLLPYLRL